MLSVEEKDGAQFSSIGEEVLEYKSVSGMALVALIIGCLSFVALFHPILWLVPLVAVIVSALAVRAITRPGSEVLGKSLAVTGLVLALFFGTWGIAEYTTARVLLFRSAKAASDQWLGMVQRRELQDAYELQKLFSKRKPAKANLVQYYGSVDEALSIPARGQDAHPFEDTSRDPKVEFAKFWSRSPQREIVVAGESGKIVFRSYGPKHRGSGMGGIQYDAVHVNYRLDYEEAGQKKSLPFVMFVKRDNLLDSFVWRVESIEIHRE